MKNQIVRLDEKWNDTALTRRLGISLPIIQGALGGFASQRLTAEVSNVGGLGSFGAHGLRAEAIAHVITEIRALTDKPFAMNLWVSTEDPGACEVGEPEFQAGLKSLLPYIAALGGTAPLYAPYAPVRFEDQARVLLEAKVPVFSFICGVPSNTLLQACRAQGIVTIGTATTVEEAVALEQAGVDAISASGFEAGGHRGSFLRPAAQSLIGTFSLLPQIADAVAVPVIAAGGVADARGVVAALALGADGVQIGTAFLAADGSGAHRLHRDALLNGEAGDTQLTRSNTGRLARGIRNQLMQILEESEHDVLPYPLQRGLVKHLTALAEQSGRTEWMQMWAGQSANLTQFTSATEFLQHLVSELGGCAA